MSRTALNVLVWNEGLHEVNQAPPNISSYYPGGIHGAIADGLRRLLPEAVVGTAVLGEPEHGLHEERLEAGRRSPMRRLPSRGRRYSRMCSRYDSRVDGRSPRLPFSHPSR